MNNLVERAKEFAYERHEGQVRKGSGVPFTTHLESVVEIVKKLTEDDKVISAAWLHDVVEDTDTTLSEVRSLFGNTVAHYVNLESEDKRPGVDEKTSWRARKEEQIQCLRNTHRGDGDVFMIALGDKLANTKEMLADKRIVGNEVWGKFNNTSPIDQKWYYQSFADVIRDKSNLGGTEVFSEFTSVLSELFSL